MGMIRGDRELRSARALARATFAVASAIGALALAAGTARAISVSPLYFEGPGGFGFSPAAVASMPVAASADANAHWILAGGPSLLPGPGLVIETQLSTIHSNPQGSGGTPTEADPLIADSTWTVTNATGAPLLDAFLVFTAINIDHRYSGLRAGLDGALLGIVDYSSAGTDYSFGAIELPSLGVGQSVDVTVRYVVAGSLDYDAATNAFILPRLGIAGLVVPEPGVAAALGLGLAGLAAWRRGARRPRG